MEKPKMTEFEAKTRAECIAYFYMIGRLSVDASNADKKIREYARQLLEIAERKEKEAMNRLLGKEKEEVKNEEITASAI